MVGGMTSHVLNYYVCMYMPIHTTGSTLCLSNTNNIWDINPSLSRSVLSSCVIPFNFSGIQPGHL